jgi:CheY-like chemotaxis protein
MNRRLPNTVLLFDSRDDSRAVYAGALRLAGCTVEEAAREDAALAVLSRSRPTVIVVAFDAATRDERLGFCRTVKSDLNSGSTPILLLTETAAGTDMELATDPGVMVLTVPSDDGGKLVAAVQGVLAAQRPAPLRATIKRHRPRKAGQR